MTMKFKTLKHFNDPGHAHELTFSCYKNNHTFDSDALCQMLVNSIDRARDRHCFKLLAYVIMPDHVHMTIFPMKPEYNISRILSGVKLSSSMKILRQISSKEDRPYARLWQRGGGYDRNLVSREAVVASIQYIHANPVSKGFVKTPDEWYWSSAGYYAGHNRYPIKVDDEILASLL